MVSTGYGAFFKVELLHRFFSDFSCPDFFITPSLQTAGVLSGHHIIAKQYGHQLYAGMQLDANGKPLSVPDENLQLTFFLQLKNPLFFNYTNIPLQGPPGKVYYFTNRNDTVANGKNFLSADIPDYLNTKTYGVGDLARHPVSGIVHQAIRSSGQAAPFNLSEPTHWAAVDGARYMSERDALQWLPSLSTYTFTDPQPAAAIEVLGYNPAARNHSLTVLSKTISFAQAAPSFPLDLSGLSAGKYILRVNGREQSIYLNDELGRTKAFAVVDIFNDGTLPAAYSLPNGTDPLLPPTYTVYFLNRSTMWKYIIASGASGEISDGAGVYQFTAPAATVFSRSPIPLSESALNIKLKIGVGEAVRVACASPERFTGFTREDDRYYCSEIFLNH